MRTITIIGGGLAGLTLGIALRKRRIPVSIVEAGHYPRHRVCGEFISGRGLESLERLGLRSLLDDLGARAASSVAFQVHGRRYPVRQLPKAALCLSRFELDRALAQEFQRLGGDLRTGTRWTLPFDGEGVVRGTGRRVRSATEDWHWFGVKAHARTLALEADLEMHFFPHAYVGLCRLPGGTVNACGFFRRHQKDDTLPKFLPDLFRGSDETLSSRLSRAVWDPASICTVGGLPFSGSACPSPAECSIGDAFGFIPPATGNGMSMAFESAELAAKAVFQFASGSVSWEEARTTVAAALRRRFRGRLRRAGWLQMAIFNARLRRRVIPALVGSRWGLTVAFWATR